MIQFDDQVSIRFTSQLIKDISRVFQKLLKYFNGIAIWTSLYYQHQAFFLLILLWIWMTKSLIFYHKGTCDTGKKLPDMFA